MNFPAKGSFNANASFDGKGNSTWQDSLGTHTYVPTVLPPVGCEIGAPGFKDEWKRM